MSALQHSSRFGEKEAPKKEGTIGTAMVDLSRYGTGPVEYGTRKLPVWKDPTLRSRIGFEYAPRAGVGRGVRVCELCRTAGPWGGCLGAIYSTGPAGYNQPKSLVSDRPSVYR